MPPEGILFLTLVVFVGAVWLLRPLVVALADRTRGRSVQATPELNEEVLQELHAMRQDIAELSERMDFAERLLAKQREAPKIGQGG